MTIPAAADCSSLLQHYGILRHKDAKLQEDMEQVYFAGLTDRKMQLSGSCSRE